MKSLRHHISVRVFVLLAGITFLNMSFILAEFAMLDLTSKYKTLVQNVISTGLEEEKEVGGEGPEDPSPEREVDIIHEHLLHLSSLMHTLEHSARDVSNLAEAPGYCSIFSPPPEA